MEKEQDLKNDRKARSNENLHPTKTVPNFLEAMSLLLWALLVPNQDPPALNKYSQFSNNQTL
ncbi:hypothetical protein DHC50_12710 [Arenibacter sp. A80]|nr:hypothetical protein [Arenibacter sp. A80]RFT56226.1 hypothetical protein D0S24_12710 [Arenibacter sp. P308M17]